jgi:uncharacterized membrane protein
VRGLARVDWAFTFAAAVYNPVRGSKMLATVTHASGRGWAALSTARFVGQIFIPRSNDPGSSQNASDFFYILLI